MAPDMPGPQRGQRTGVALRDPLPWHEFVQVVESAEQAGYEALFLPEIAGRETFATLAAVAGVTSALLLGNGIAPMTSRRAQTTAMAAATVHELSGGRMILGLGSGTSFRGALERLRAYVSQVRSILTGETVALEDGGTFVLSLERESAPPPIWISALGPKAMRLAGEVADGVLLNWCTPERVAFAREAIREGAEAAGRDPASVTIAVYVRACIGQEDAASLPALREAAGQYASYPAYRRQFEAMGLGAEAAAAASAHAAGRAEDVPEALVRAVCLLGEDPVASGARLREHRDAGAHLPIVYPVPARDPVSSVLGTLFALAPSAAVES